MPLKCTSLWREIQAPLTTSGGERHLFYFFRVEVIAASSWTENYRLMELHFHRHFGVRGFQQMYALGISPPHSGDNVLIILTEARLCCVL